MARIDATMVAMKSFFSGALVFALALLPSVASAQRDSSVYMEDRMNQLQQTITMLTGQVEQLQYQNQQLKQQLDKMQTDYDFRLDQRVVYQAVCGNHPRPDEPPPGRRDGARRSQTSSGYVTQRALAT